MNELRPEQIATIRFNILLIAVLMESHKLGTNINMISNVSFKWLSKVENDFINHLHNNFTTVYELERGIALLQRSPILAGDEWHIGNITLRRYDFQLQELAVAIDLKHEALVNIHGQIPPDPLIMQVWLAKYKVLSTTPVTWRDLYILSVDLAMLAQPLSLLTKWYTQSSELAPRYKYLILLQNALRCELKLYLSKPLLGKLQLQQFVELACIANPDTGYIEESIAKLEQILQTDIGKQLNERIGICEFKKVEVSDMGNTVTIKHNGELITSKDGGITWDKISTR